MNRSVGLVLVGMGVLLVWAAWANVNPWDELRAAFSPAPARAIDPSKPSRKPTSP